MGLRLGAIKWAWGLWTRQNYTCILDLCRDTFGFSWLVLAMISALIIFIYTCLANAICPNLSPCSGVVHWVMSKDGFGVQRLWMIVASIICYRIKILLLYIHKITHRYSHPNTLNSKQHSRAHRNFIHLGARRPLSDLAWVLLLESHYHVLLKKH